MNIRILDDTHCEIYDEVIYEGTYTEDEIVLENFFVNADLMNFLSEGDGNWVLGENTYTQAIMLPCQIIDNKMFCTKLTFKK